MMTGTGHEGKKRFRPVTLALVLVLAALLMLTTGCEGDDSDGDTNGDKGTSATCDACVEQKCSSQLKACENNVDCNAILECLENCSQSNWDACMNTCVNSNPGGIALFENLGDCVESKCPACTGKEGDDEDGDDNSLSGCQDCVDRMCPAQLAACENDPDCDAILDCIDDCTGGDLDACISACVSAYPGGLELFESVIACAEANCPACSGAGDDDDGDDDDSTGPSADCDACVSQECWLELSACESFPACDAILECLEDCDHEGDWEACMMACVSANPGGAPLFDDLGDCVEASCPACTDG